MDAQQQQILDFSSPQNDVLALIARLRDVEIILEGKAISAGRKNGIVELLQRITLFSKQINADQVQAIAAVNGLAARITGRRTVQDKTIRNWSADARRLGLLVVQVRTHEFGGSAWNVWSIPLEALRNCVQSGTQFATEVGRKRPETAGNDFRPWGGNDYRPINRREEVEINPVDRNDRSTDRENRSNHSPQSTGNVSRKEEQAAPLDLSNVDWDEVGNYAEAVGKRIPPRTDQDRRAWLKYAVLAYTTFSEAWLIGCADAARNAKEVRTTRQALFVAALQNAASEQHDVTAADFHQIFGRIEIPTRIWKSPILQTKEKAPCQTK